MLPSVSKITPDYSEYGPYFESKVTHCLGYINVLLRLVRTVYYEVCNLVMHYDFPI